MFNKSLNELTNNNKGIFPYKFININTLNYNGPLPSLDFYTNVDLLKYNEYYKDNNIFNVKKETLKYLKQDLLILYKFMMENNKTISLSHTPRRGVWGGDYF
uniref:DNA-directed DNA polymerase n=1 Tax=Torulaspora franciscae TaxID=53488 RepID=A0A0H3V210_9SACH|nr:hypothetical protein [Torulaspora franciscae]AJG02996.1 hypothetical protein [Torulaspora franciscae]AJG03005.1 hypothetical protein [Torulaspora franciscae]